MEIEQIIEEIKALEELLAQVRQRCYGIRKDLEPFSAPAPSGDTAEQQNKAAVIAAVNKRRSAYYKANKNDSQ